MKNSNYTVIIPKEKLSPLSRNTLTRSHFQHYLDEYVGCQFHVTMAFMTERQYNNNIKTFENVK